MKPITDILTLREVLNTKHNFEFQEICEDLEPDFGKLVWTLPFKIYCTEYKLREAGRIARLRGILRVSYLIGILKKLP